MSVNLSASGRPECVDAEADTPSFLSMIGHRFLLGRGFPKLERDCLPGCKKL
jgi:hypothetical protein